MSAKDTVRGKKTDIQATLSADYRLILNKVHQKNLITGREYNNLKSINKEDVEGHVTELVDKIMNKGEETCQAFLDLLQTDEDIKSTYPALQSMQLNNTSLLPRPIQACSVDNTDGLSQHSERQKEVKQYQLNSQPTGLCVIINNENFKDGHVRRGTNKDAQSLAEVFSWLGFRVLMCKDQTKVQMEHTLTCFASPRDLAQMQELDVKEWSGNGFADVKGAPNHGDAFICCILSHGKKGVVLGIDYEPLSIKQITRTFKATDHSALTGKPKVFLIQACQGGQIQHGVLLKHLQADDSNSLSIPEESDVLVAIATVEDHAERHNTWGLVHPICVSAADGGLSKVMQEKLGIEGEDLTNILCQVNDEVGQREGSIQPGRVKQMPEVRFTLRKRLVLSPRRQ